MSTLTLEVDDDLEAAMERLKKAFDFLQAVLAGVDSELSPDIQLNTMANDLNEQVVAQILAYVNNGNVQHLKNANDQFTTQIPTILQMSGVGNPTEGQNAKDGGAVAFDQFRKAVDKSKEDYIDFAEGNAAQLSALGAQAAQLSISLDNLQTATTAQMSTWQGEFTDAQTTRSEEHSAAQTQRGQEHDTALRDFNSVSDKDRAEMARKHTQALNTHLDGYKNDGDGVYKKDADDEWGHASMGYHSLIIL